MLIEDVARGGRRRVEIARPLALKPRGSRSYICMSTDPPYVYISSHIPLTTYNGEERAKAFQSRIRRRSRLRASVRLSPWMLSG